MSTTALTAPETEAISFDQFNPNDATNSSTLKFIGFYLASQGDAISKAFTTIITSKSTTLAADVAAFAAYPLYSACTLDTYLEGMVYQAQQQDSISKPADEKKYSLSMLVKLLGGKWPDGMPDITIAKPSCSFANGTLNISFELDFTTISFENALIEANVKKLVTQTSIQASFTGNFQPASNLFESKISIQFDDIKLPVSSSDSLTVKAPTVSLDFTPAFKYVVFTLSGAIPATIFNTPIDIDLSLLVDNDEANIGASIVGNNASLPAPPGVKGLHFDEIGIGMGLFFEPPGFAFGLEGKFHIGDAAGNVVDLDDDTFALVCEYVEEAITPKYVGFYIPKLDLSKVLELFTNAKPNIDVPVNFTDLSFHWSSGLNDSIALPDGSLSPSGYGFSAAVDIFHLVFYGEMNLDQTTGLSATVELSPLTMEKVFKLTGDGKGYSIKVDAAGNPVKNNFVPATKAGQDAIANATLRQLVSPGGASLIINTLSMPILHLNAKASLFDLLDCDIAADINKDGIKFELDYGVVLTTKMVCNLADFHNLYAEFGYFIDHSIPLPTIANEPLGSIPLKADIDAHLSLSTSTSFVMLSTSGKFDFEGYHFSFGELSGAVNISKISELIGAVISYMVSEAKTIFNQLIDTAEHWAQAAGKGIITGFSSAGKIMRYSYNKSKEEMATILKGAGFTADLVGSELRNAYGAASQDVAAAMKAAGYAAGEVAGAIKNAWNCGVSDVTRAMQQVGYVADDIATGLKTAFNAAAQDVADSFETSGITAEQTADAIKNVFNLTINETASALKGAGYATDLVASALKNAFNTSVDVVADAMKQVGYAADDVKNAFVSLGGDFKSLADTAWSDTKHYLNPSNW